jgi:hypothetical protein
MQLILNQSGNRPRAPCKPGLFVIARPQYSAFHGELQTVVVKGFIIGMEERTEMD